MSKDEGRLTFTGMDQFSLGAWLVAEAMGSGQWSVTVGDVLLSVRIRKGVVDVVIVDEPPKRKATR